MGYGYLALWVAGRFGRDYGSLDGPNGGDSTDRHASRDDRESGQTGVAEESDRSHR